MDIASVPFPLRFSAALRTGTRPTTPEGVGDSHWDASTTTLSLADAAGTSWVEYDLSLITGNTVANGGTGFTAYATGDLLVGNPGTTLSKLGVGSNGQVLVADSGQTLGVKWGSGFSSSGAAVIVSGLQDGTAIPSSSATAIPALGVTGNIASNFTVSGGVLTCNTPGTYLVRAEINVDATNFSTGPTGNLLLVQLFKNAAALAQGQVFQMGATGEFLTCITPTAMVVLAATDTLIAKVGQNTGSNVNLVNTGGTISQIYVEMLT